MFSLEDRPTLPETPVFSTEMADFLMAAARTSPRRRTAAKTSFVVSMAALALVLVIGVTVALLRTGSVQTAAKGGPVAVSLTPVHVHLAAFSVDTDPGGTVTLTVTMEQTADPNTMRQALAQAGVPASITIGSFCRNPSPSKALFRVVSPHRPRPDGTYGLVITPSAMPKGAELSIGYLPAPAGAMFKYNVGFTLLSPGAPVACSSTPSHPQGLGRPTP
jgi:hypothetical protein